MKSAFNKFSSFQKGSFFMILAVLFGANAYIFIRYVFNNYQTSIYNAAFWSSLGAIIGVIPFLLFSDKKRYNAKQTLKKNLKTVVLTVLISLIATVTWFFIARKIPADSMSLLDQTAIFWSILLGVFFLNEKINIIKIIGFFISLCGILLVLKTDLSFSIYTIAIALLGPFLYGLQSFVIKKYSDNIDGFSLAWLRGFFLLIGFGVTFGLMGEISVISGEEFIFLSIGQFSGLIIGRMFFIEAHKYLPISELNFFFLLSPVVIFFISPFIEQDFNIYPIKYLGSLLVILGLIIFLLPQKKLTS